MPSAVGERQMLPRHTNVMRIGSVAGMRGVCRFGGARATGDRQISKNEGGQTVDGAGKTADNDQTANSRYVRTDNMEADMDTSMDTNMDTDMNMNDFAGRSGAALVTGGTGGIGAAICRMLATRGSDVFFTFRSNAVAAAELEQELRSLGVRAVSMPLISAASARCTTRACSATT